MCHDRRPARARARRTRRHGRQARRASSAPPSTSSPRAASSTPRSPTSRAPPASPPARSTCTSAARTTCSISIFERTMKEAIADGRDSRRRLARPGRAAAPRSRGCTSAASAAIATSPSSSRSSCGSRRNSWSASRRRYLRDYLGIIRDAIADGQATGRVPRRHQPDRSPPRCSSARSTRWRPTGSSAAAVLARGATPTPSSTCSSTERGRR